MGSVSGSNVDQPFKDLLEGVERLDRLLWDALEILLVNQSLPRPRPCPWTQVVEDRHHRLVVLELYVQTLKA